jgi:hypothetical protein
MSRLKSLLLVLFALLPLTAEAVTHDILVLYTNAAAARRGVQLFGLVSTAISTTNKVHTDSGTGIQVRILAYEPSPMQESGNFTITGPQLTQNAAVKARRDALGADLVLLVSEDSGCGGWGSMMWAKGSGGQLTYLEAFAVVTSSCLSGLTVAHEIGHMQGLLHNREDSGADGLASGFHFGYRVCAVGGFRDVMSYQCPGINVTQLKRFSDPTALYNGIPMGIAYEVAPYQAADAVRQLKINGPLIAVFRNSNVP